MITIERSTTHFALSMQIVPMGNDLAVSLQGGDAPHVGAVALAVPHPGLRTQGKTDASVSLLVVTGHKEDQLARKIAYTLATHGNRTVSVTCGIHMDNATDQDIAMVLETADTMLRQALLEL